MGNLERHEFEVVLQEPGELAIWRAAMTVEIDPITRAIVDYKLEFPDRIRVLATWPVPR